MSAYSVAPQTFPPARIGRIRALMWDNETTPSRVNELGASPPVPAKES